MFLLTFALGELGMLWLGSPCGRKDLAAGDARTDAASSGLHGLCGGTSNPPALLLTLS